MSEWQWRIDEDRERLSWLRGKWMTERTSDVHFQRKVSRRYHGSHCDSEINFNGPLWRFCVTLPLPFSFFLFLSFFFFLVSTIPSPNLAAMTSEQTHVHVVRQDPESLCTWKRKMGGGGSLHKRFITNVSNPLLHCQGDVIKHTL